MGLGQMALVGDGAYYVYLLFSVRRTNLQVNFVLQEQSGPYVGCIKVTPIGFMNSNDLFSVL